MEKIFDIDKIWAYCISALALFFEPLWVLMMWFLIFIMADFVTGIWASKTEGKLITSHKMRQTVWKFIMYAMAIILLQGIDKHMITLLNLELAKIGATIICGIELHSIFENCYRITGNQVFKVLTQFTVKKIEDNTGVNIKGEK